MKIGMRRLTFKKEIIQILILSSIVVKNYSILYLRSNLSIIITNFEFFSVREFVK